jgi:hypothetical protein
MSDSAMVMNTIMRRLDIRWKGASVRDKRGLIIGHRWPRGVPGTMPAMIGKLAPWLPGPAARVAVGEDVPGLPNASKLAARSRFAAGTTLQLGSRVPAWRPHLRLQTPGNSFSCVVPAPAAQPRSAGAGSLTTDQPRGPTSLRVLNGCGWYCVREFGEIRHLWVGRPSAR